MDYKCNLHQLMLPFAYLVVVLMRKSAEQTSCGLTQSECSQGTKRWSHGRLWWELTRPLRPCHSTAQQSC